VDFFDMDSAQGAWDQFNDQNHPRHHVTHELMAGAAGFEAMHLFEEHQKAEGRPVHHELAKAMLAGFAAAEIDKHFEGELFSHLDQGQAHDYARQQAHYLYDQQYGGQQQDGYDSYGDQGYGQQY
jgi:hypothetical protein